MRHQASPFAGNRQRRRRGGILPPTIFTGVAVGVAATMFISSAASAAGLDAYPDDPAEAEASVIDSTILGQDIAGGAHSEAGFPTNPGTNQEGLNLSLLGDEVIDLGGLSIPIDEFIDYGQVGALLSESTATDARNAEAISGLAGGDGALTLDGDNADFGAASFDLLTLFNEAGVDGVTDLLVDQATLLLGAGGAHVVAEDGEFLDQDGFGGAGQYRAGEASLLLHSDSIDEAAGMIYDTIGSIDDEMETQVNRLLDLTDIISALPGGVTLDATIESNMQEEIFDAILAEPITTNNTFLTVDFSTGTVELRLDQLLSGDSRPGDPTGINSQNPNTELIDDEIYPMIAENVHQVMEEVTNITVGAIEGALASVTVHLTATIEEPLTGSSATATWDLNLMGDLAEIDCTSTGITGGALCATLTAAVNVLGPIASTVVEPVRDFIVGDAGQEIFDLLVRDIKTGSITVPIRMALEPFIEILAQVVSLQLNHQVTEVCTAPDGTEHVSSLEVSAISLGLAQAVDGARLSLGNAGARVDACNLAANVPSIEVATPVPAGECAVITSAGWAPDTEVSFQLTDADGNPVGDAVVVTTDADGNVPADTCVVIPEDAPPGDYTVVGTDPDGNTAEATVVVYAPVLEIETPVAPGECAVVTSSGWAPDTEVTIQLTDADGNPVGDAVVVTADADGNLPADTCVVVPDDAAPGDYTVVGTDDNGAEVTAPVEVSDDAADAPSLEASSPVPSGTDAEVTSTGWAPDTEITLVLTDADGNPVGDPVVVTTDADGNVPDGTVVPVPADAAPGDYTVVGTDPDGNTAEAPVTVYAPVLEVAGPVAPGDEAEVTSGGWLPDTEVTLQLTDADGNPVGDPVIVTTDADGNVPAGTAIPVPADAAPGDYTVVGTDDNGAEIIAPVEVSDDAATGPSLEASSPVPAGGDVEVTSDGWTPDTEVSLQLTDADGNPVGDPVVVTTDADGNVPDGTVVPVPADAAAGDYTVVGTDPDGNTADGPVAVYAPVLEIETPVAPGECAVVTSSGWAPDTEVTIQLTDADGNPVGDAVVVTADADGNLPADTCVVIPEDAAPGDYTVVGSDDNGAEVTTPVEVSDDATDGPSIEATSPVPAGSDVAVTSTGWAPDTEVSLQLTDADGNPVGDPVVVTTDADGNVPDGTVVPVPADAAPGDYTVVGTDPDGNTAEAPVAVYAPVLEVSGPVAPGDEAEVTSTGWAPESEVSLQLTDADGDPVGDPVVVTTDADGNIPAGTTLPVPDDAAPGDYTVVGTDDNGAEVTAPVTVSDDAAGGPAIEATSPVPAGGDTAVTSTGWAPDIEVSLQLTDADGNPVGDPVVVTTDVDGNVPAGTTLPVPADAAAGDYTVVGTDADGNTADAAVAVYAPTLEVAGPVGPGEEAEVTSGGWMPDTEVTLVLTDADGNPVGDPVVVTTDADGNVPAGTTLPVPADAAAGDYAVVGSDDNGAEVTTPVIITDAAGSTCAADPALMVDPSSVTPGATVAVTGAGFAAGAAATVQLNDADGNPVLDPALTVAVGDDCGFAIDVAIPADAAAGEYEIVVEDDGGNSAVIAITIGGDGSGGGGDVIGDLIAELLKATVEQGGDQTVTGNGFAVGELVTITDEGSTIAIVAADAGGQVTKTWTVSDTAELGARTVTLTGETSGSVDVTYSVVASESGSLAVTGSDGWGVLFSVALLLMVLGGAFVVTRRREAMIEQ